MRVAVVLLGASFMASCARPVPPGTERVENLGYGFRRITIAVPNSFEVGHHEHLFYRDRDLCQVGLACSVSPSGKFAAYQDGPSGDLFLFRCGDQKVIQLTPKFIAVAYKFVWHEDRGTIEAQFETGHPPRTFSLP